MKEKLLHGNGILEMEILLLNKIQFINTKRLGNILLYSILKGQKENQDYPKFGMSQ
jgi:hypothetical protein